jgi:hypothetical protein
VQPIASWLVARPERAVFVLIATFPLPFTQILGSTVLVLLVLSRGIARAAQVAGIAFLAILAMTLVTTVPVQTLIQIALTIWLPGMLLAILLQRTRSLTLSLQITVLAALLVIVGLFVVAGDSGANWQEVFKEFASLLRDNGKQQEADLFIQLLPYAPYMRGFVVSIGWLVHVAAFLAGYAAYMSLAGKPEGFGRVSEINFGRVLAAVLALTSIVAMVGSSIWLQNIALLLFAMFWLQGLAMLHWLRARGRFPSILLAAVYVLTVLLGPLLVSAVGVMGYTDAWFDYRPRIARK